MILKEFEFPERLMKIDALRRRLPNAHQIFPKVDSEYKRRLAGHWGEKSLLYYLGFLDEKRYRIFHNLRLPDSKNGHFFEMDVFLLTPTLLIPIDSKNYRGELYFDELFDQLIQTFDDVKKAFPSPLAQINRHQFQLGQLLQVNKYPQIPIAPLLVITNPAAIITASQNHRQVNKIIKSANLPSKINMLENLHKDKVLDNKQLHRLSKLLLKLHTPYDKCILEEFGVHERELLKGVHCPNCETLQMRWAQRKWECISCGFSSRSAHHSAINDYKLLIGNTITNQKLRNFLQLPSRSAATRILKSLNLTFGGEKKGREYIL